MSWKQRYRTPITEFQKGKYYRYTGNKRDPTWTSDGDMDFVLDNKPRLCVWASKYCADFGDGNSWAWGSSIELWEEC